jgi:type II secretory ATPase GspE/PulE/Tfp pilus assembly ATPase PilB-like protein/CheY-like chemotaxis protein
MRGAAETFLAPAFSGVARRSAASVAPLLVAMNRPSAPHWLSSVAQHAGLELPLPATPDVATLRNAWTAVVRACKVPEERFVERVAAHFRIGVADLSTWDPQAVRLIPETVARKYGALAISFTNTNIVVATSDPSNRVAAQEITAHSGRQPVFLLVSPSRMDHAIERAYAPARAPKNALQTLVAQVAQSDFQVVTASGTGLFTSFDLQDPAVVKLSDTILQPAVRYRATEIHVEPGRQQGRIRYRIDGVLQHVVDLPSAAHTRLAARLKSLALDRPGADPNDGFPIRTPEGGERTGHLLTTPTPEGALISVRLLSPKEIPTLDGLGFGGPEGEKIRELLRRRDGLLLVTGPARAGTTSFVYACMHALSRLSVISLETRIEQVIPGVTQIRYESSTGRSFAESLQALLDRSPDVIHAGEIRDLATARIAIRTAVTGRKTIGTLHTSDAVSGLRRMMDMGVDGGRLAESCHAVISLRLVRRLCPDCKKRVDPAAHPPSREVKLAARLGVQPAFGAVGCKACAGTGYRGQLPLAEVLELTPPVKSFLQSDPSDADLLKGARNEGMRTFAEVGLDLVAQGETTIEEVERVVGIVPVQERTAASIGPVLIVDDEAQDRLIIKGVLDAMGFQVVEAESAIAAKTLIEERSHDFSLVLLDEYMPEMNGRELLREVRKSLVTQSLPVIVISSASDPQVEIDLLEAGADDYITKPVHADRVEARVRAVLRRSGVELS